MSTKHKLRTVLSFEGDPEIEVEIAFTFLRGAPERGPNYWSGGQPADPDEIEFIGAARLFNGKPEPFCGPSAALAQEWLDDIASHWLETDEGQAEAIEAVADDDDAAREYAAEMRRDA